MRRTESKDPIAAFPVRAAIRAKRARAVGLSCITMLVASITAGCSGPLLTMGTKPDAGDAEPDKTGSVAAGPSTFGNDLTAEDWRRAYAALGVALDPQGNGRPVQWQNPDSASHGSIDPSGLPYVSQDAVCRDFRTTVTTADGDRLMRGTGCKLAGGSWFLKRLSTIKA